MVSLDPLQALQIGEEQRIGAPAPRSGRSRRTLWLGVGALAVVALVGGAWRGLRPGPAPAPIAAVPPESPPRNGQLTAGGYVRHARIVAVVPRVSGLVATLLVAEGDVVREGDLIATLERSELEQQVAESRAELRAAQARLAELAAGGRREELAGARARVEALGLTAARLARERARSDALARAGVVTPQAREGAETESLVADKTLEAARQSLALLEAGPRPETVAAARAAVDAARARLARAGELLGRTEIRAPLGGRVLRKHVEVGAAVSYGVPYTEGYSTIGPGTPIVSIGQLEGLEAVADVNQTDLGRLSPGEQVVVTAQAYPGRTYPARLARFAPRADRNKNTVEVTVRFDEPAPRELAHDLSVKLSFQGAAGHPGGGAPRDGGQFRE